MKGDVPMSKRDITALVVKKQGECEIKVLKDTLKSYQNIVEGYIETVTFEMRDTLYVAICNEEGRLKGMPYNLSIAGKHLVGPVMFVRVDGENFASLTADDIKHLKNMFNLE